MEKLTLPLARWANNKLIIENQVYKTNNLLNFIFSQWERRLLVLSVSVMILSDQHVIKHRYQRLSVHRSYKVWFQWFQRRYSLKCAMLSNNSYPPLFHPQPIIRGRSLFRVPIIYLKVLLKLGTIYNVPFYLFIFVFVCVSLYTIYKKLNFKGRNVIKDINFMIFV